MDTLGEAFPKKFRDKLWNFSKSDKLKKVQEAFKPYSSGEMIKKTIKGEYKTLVEKMKRK